MTNPTWYLYMIRCKGNKLYTGITTDVTRRFGEHQAGKGAKFLRGKTPLELVFQHEVGTHSQALKLELWVKKQAKINKENIIQQGLPANLQLV
ncbi:MAG: GIY-YIG nuclease family protein [Ghiorsea sp.]|nr:GIY-YIG nuclease family protein [Ghiorsea sp.]